MTDDEKAAPGRAKAFAELNQDLLGAAAGEPAAPEAPKRNTKDELIDKIEKLSAEQGIPVEQSRTKLRRMTKRQLAQLLARMIEDHVQNQVCDKVGVERGAPPNLVALGALRMVHDIAAGTSEKVANIFLPSYGYEVVGFAQALKDPQVREATDQCLLEISRESNILEHIQSPYVRLGLAWGGALVSTVHRVPEPPPMRRARPGPRKLRPMYFKEDNVADVGQQPAPREDTPKPRVRRRTPVREERRPSVSSVEDAD
jgi:hypothetical protein